MSNNPKFLETYILDKNFPSDGNEPRPRATRQAATTGAGTLEQLPFDILTKVLEFVDLRSIANLSYTSRAALRICEDHTPFRTLVTHAPRAVWYILTSDAGAWTSVTGLYRALMSTHCGSCTETIAGYYDIFAGTRICHVCLRREQSDHKELHPLRYDTAAGAYALDAETMDSLPHIRTLPGRELPTAYDGAAGERVTMFSCEAARAAGIKRHGSEEAMEAAAMAERMRQHGTSLAEETRMSACRVCYAQHRAYYRDRVQTDNALYWLGVLRLPLLNRATGTAERSFYCPGCRGYSFSKTPEFRRRFLSVDYERHLQLLGPVLIRWHDKHNLLRGETSDREIINEISECYTAHDAALHTAAAEMAAAASRAVVQATL